MNRIKIVSFDVDGTLVSPDFVNAVWLEGIPHEYASENGIDFRQAYSIVCAAYNEIGENRIEWYDLRYWLRRFNLKITMDELFNRYKHRIRIYEDVEYVLNALKDAGYDMIISSNAAREFIFFQIKPILHYFSHVFSATSDFKEVKKSREFYMRVCVILGVHPREVVHIGDHPVFDYQNPIKAGMNALLLRRHGADADNDVDHIADANANGDCVRGEIKNLNEVLRILNVP